jgi:hypothetical protein
MPITIALPLDLPDVRVLASRLLEEGTLLIEVESTLPTPQCYRCGREMDRFHGYDRPIRLRHCQSLAARFGSRFVPSATAVRCVKGTHPNAALLLVRPQHLVASTGNLIEPKFVALKDLPR